MKLAIALFLGLISSSPVTAKNGFDLSDTLVPEKEIRKGGPPKDGIPALFYPAHIAANEADYLTDDDRVMGFAFRGEARAYPIKMLNWHEVVNDKLGAQHYVVTYCPLCGTGMVFGSNTGDAALVFGVSGLLYNSDVLLYDLQTESLWSQIMSKAISGKLIGTPLPQLPARHTTWSDWKAQHPETLVLDNRTRLRRNYNTNPYAGYERTKRLMFPVNEKSDREIHPKASVLGIQLGNQSKAYLLSAFAKSNQTIMNDQIADQRITVHYNADARTAWVTDASGAELPSTIAFWFAWYAFHPQTAVVESLD